MSYFIMHRKGKCYPRVPSHNQCKVTGHPDYSYDLSMIFPSSMTLDENHFIIDHQAIDDLITSSYIRGSCEQMHLKIAKKLIKFFHDKELPILAFKVILQGDSTDMAFMEYAHIDSSNHHLIPLL